MPRGWSSEKDPTGELHAAAGRKGGKKVSADRQHMSDIGKIGGSRHSPEHMAEIGRKGGQAVSKNKEHMREIGKRGAPKPAANA